MLKSTWVVFWLQRSFGSLDLRFLLVRRKSTLICAVFNSSPMTLFHCSFLTLWWCLVFRLWDNYLHVYPVSWSTLFSLVFMTPQSYFIDIFFYMGTWSSDTFIFDLPGMTGTSDIIRSTSRSTYLHRPTS